MGTRCNLVGDERSMTERVKHPLACERDGYDAYAQKRNENYCIIVCDPCVSFCNDARRVRASNPDAFVIV